MIRAAEAAPVGPPPAGPQAVGHPAGRLGSMAAAAGDPAIEADSPRLAAARARVEERRQAQRGLLHPLGWSMIAIVVAGTAQGHPAPGLDGQAAGVSVALCAYVVAFVAWLRGRSTETSDPVQAAPTVILAAAAVALTALQPRGASELAASAAVWMAVTRLPLRPGLGLGLVITVALGVAEALSGTSSATVVAATLLCLLLGLMAHFMKRAAASQAETEVLLARLEDARDDHSRAVALAERSRIAGELHDVLAHSLSGAAIQLQGARVLAERAQAPAPVRAAIGRASELVKDGLGDARRAVSALRGDDLPTVEALGTLVASFRDDLGLDATLRIAGASRPVAPEASLALYRGAQEALTNVARHAPGAPTVLDLRYGPDRIELTVENRLPQDTPPPTGGDLSRAGGGRGLTGMRERVERAGGTVEAGPTDGGWRVELALPG